MQPCTEQSDTPASSHTSKATPDHSQEPSEYQLMTSIERPSSSQPLKNKRLQTLWSSFGLPVALGLAMALVILLGQFLLQQSSDSPLSSAQSAASTPNTQDASNTQLSRLSSPLATPTNSVGDLRVSYADAVAKAAPAVVNIYTRKQVPRRRSRLMDDPLFRRFFNNSNQSRQQRMESALGSGVIVDKQGYILTNHHVIDRAVEIVVLLYDGRESTAEVIGSDQASDLAVLKIDLPNLATIPLGNTRTTRIGDVVLAIGNPLGVGQTVTQGIISAKSRYGLGLNTYEDYIQTDAAINPGNSGGALVNAYGELIGINTAILSETVGKAVNTVGISFAIPSDQAMNALDSIITYGRVVRGWLGIEVDEISRELAQLLGLSGNNGVIVQLLHPHSPAAYAGLREGDVITHIDEMPIGDGQLGLLRIGKKRPGDEAILDVIRGDQKLSLKATLIERPN